MLKKWELLIFLGWELFSTPCEHNESCTMIRIETSQDYLEQSTRKHHRTLMCGTAAHGTHCTWPESSPEQKNNCSCQLILDDPEVSWRFKSCKSLAHLIIFNYKLYCIILYNYIIYCIITNLSLLLWPAVLEALVCRLLDLSFLAVHSCSMCACEIIKVNYGKSQKHYSPSDLLCWRAWGLKPRLMN